LSKQRDNKWVEALTTEIDNVGRRGTMDMVAVPDLAVAYDISCQEGSPRKVKAV
jgi:hypothetical protein